MRIRVLTPFVLLTLTLATAAGAREIDPPLARASLYDRLGGLYPISAVVDDFIERVYVNAILNANPHISAARSAVRKPGLKVNVANLVCTATGGPCRYTGKGMKESHAGFHVSPKEWDALLADFRATLARFAVPAAEQKELIDIVESTRVDIVEGATAPGRK